ncbi:MAG: DUF4153 domain-containing protein [Candidatus Gracilibacteria bacterium]
MKFPSISDLYEKFLTAVKRFPISMLAAFTAVVCAVRSNHLARNAYAMYDGSRTPEFFLQQTFISVILTMIFVFLLAFAVDIFVESRGGKTKEFWIGRIGVLVVGLGSYLFFFKNYPDWLEKDFMKFTIISGMALMLILLAPFMKKGIVNGFWQWTLALIKRFLAAFVFFGILFLGVVMLLASVDYLFSITIDGEYYGDVWFVITGILAVTYFLFGVPSDFKKLDKTTEYPRALKLIVEYFLVPLTSLYLIVLYAYTGKIVGLWQWPEGGVAIWIMAFSFVGVMTYFFSFAVKEKFISFVGFFRKTLFALLVPLVAVLFFAVWLRIQDYGMTEPRYFIVLFGIWLLVMAGYFLFSKKKDLKILPAGIFVALLVSMAGGPVGAFGISEADQLGRLQALFEKNGMMENGKFVEQKSANINGEDATSVTSIIQYLVMTHGVEGLQRSFTSDLKGMAVDHDPWQTSDKIMTLIGVAPNYGMPENSFYMNVDCGMTGSCVDNVEGFTYMASFYGNDYPDQPPMGEVDYEMIIGDGKYGFSLKDNVLTMKRAGDSNPFTFDLTGLMDWETQAAKFDNVKGMVVLPDENRIIRFSKWWGTGEIRLENVNGEIVDGVVKINNVSGKVLFK